MHQLVIQLIEPTDVESPWMADAWLFSDKMALMVHEQGLEVSNIDVWVQDQVKTGKAMALVELTAFAPPSRGHLRVLSISKGQQRYMNDIAPSLMESFLAQPVEDIHFVSRVVDAENVFVSAIDREFMALMSQVVSMITATKKRLLLPQSLLSEAVDEDDCVSFLGLHYHFLNGHLFPLPASLAAQSSRQPSKLLDESFLAQCLSKSKSWQGINLFEREFAQQSYYQHSARLLKVGSLLFSLGLAISCSWLHYETSVYQQQAAAVEVKANKVFLELAPEEGRVVNLKRQIEGRLRANQSQQKTDQQDYSPYLVLKRIEEAKQEVKGQNEIQLIAYRDGVYVLEWAAVDQDTLAIISKIFTRLKLDAYLDQVVREDKLYVGSYRIQGML